MLDDDSPGFGVVFEIDAEASIAEVTRLAALMESLEVRVVTQAGRIERAANGMISFGGATAEVKTFSRAAVEELAVAEQQIRSVEKAATNMISFGGATAEVKTFAMAATKELAASGREMRAVEKSGEAMVRQLERQAAAFGKTREELRYLKSEENALAAERTGNLDLATRIRAAEQALFDQELAAGRRMRAETEALAQEKEEAANRAVIAAERDAQAMRSAANAHAMFEAAARRGMAVWREQQAAEAAVQKSSEAARLRLEAASADLASRAHAQLAAHLRETHAAMEADAAAAERMRASTDPLYAAVRRLNVEIAESTRLYHVGATAPAEYARQQDVLAGRLRIAQAEHDATAKAAKRGASSLTQLSFQVNDVVTMAASGAPIFQIFATQIGQIVQVGQMAEGGMRGLAGEVGGLLLRFAPLIGVMSAAVVGFALFDRSVSDGIDTKKMIDGLGLTHAEIKRLKNTTVDTGDVIVGTFQVIAERVGLDLGNMKKWFGDAMDFMTRIGAGALAGLYAGFVGTFDAIGIVIRGIKDGKGASAILGDIDKNMTKRFDQAHGAISRFGKDVRKQIEDNKLAELQKQATEIKADRTPHKPKIDHHAEQLAREAEAIERQIANLYKLADAYGVSGAAALIAEARVRAESKAVKRRADIEAAVAREIRLEIAQRVSDAAKGTAAMRDQAAMQEQVNAAVANGNVPAARAADLMRDRMADLPLLAALQAAQMSGDIKGAEAAEKALDDQRAARDRLTDAERQAALLQATAAGKDRLAELQEELRLVGATDRARAVALATLKATQEAEANGWTGQKAADYIKQQAKIADQQQTLTENQNAWNASLGYTAELFDEIDHSVQSAASGMADAFGDVGRAIGDAASIMTGFYARQAQLQKDHEAAIRSAGGNQAAIDHENQVYALRTATMRIGAYGDMTAAAKGFFKQGSAGFKAMGAAEKAFRAIELAMALKNAAVQVGLIGGVTAARTVATGTGIAADTAYTAASIANSGARASADATAAMAKTAASAPFPLNLAGMAVMAAALASIGLATGFFGGGGKNTLTKANDGSGTVLGDATAKSESLKRAIEQLRDVDTTTATFARQMASSLRSIDDQIGGFAAQIARADNVDASAGVDAGFKTNAIGSVLKAVVPIFGGALASLFGTKTTVLAGGLYGKAQSIGDILAGGFDASTYSDVEKKKKFFGITTSTKHSTQYGAADSGLENQFTLILRSFSTAIAAAAGPLGEATDAVQARLNGFVLDIGKIDLKGLTGTEIQEKLEAVFGAAADDMANAAFPGIGRFQKAGEGMFETLVRVSSTLEAVSGSLDLLGNSARGLSIDAKLGLADQFDSIGDLTSAADGYFTTFYSKAEQNAARAAQMTRSFEGLGLAMPATLDAFRHLVEAQDLTTTSGQSTYAALLRLAPAFADLAASMDGAKSAADVASEREDLECRLLELSGNTAAIRAAELAKLDASNRALQEQIYAIEDAQEAAKAAEQLREAWTSVGDSIMDEVKRIRGLTDAGDGGSFADLLSQFNAANIAARAGDMDVAKTLPALSQALLGKASDVATSRQELVRVQAQTAAALEATYGVIGSLSAPRSTSTSAQLTAAADSQGGTTAIAANDDTATELRALREEVAGMRRDNNAGHAATASNTGRIDRKLEDVTAASGGAAISVTSAAA